MVALTPTFHRMEKAEKTGLSLSPAQRRAAQDRADRTHRGNFSAYVQDLIAADLSNKPINTALSANIIVELATVYGGYFSDRLREQLTASQVDQKLLLHNLLRDVCEVFACAQDNRKVRIKDIVVRHASHVSWHTLPDAFRKDDDDLRDQDIVDMNEFVEFRREAMLTRHSPRPPREYQEPHPAEQYAAEDRSDPDSAVSSAQAEATVSPKTPPAPHAARRGKAGEPKV